MRDVLALRPGDAIPGELRRVRGVVGQEGGQDGNEAEVEVGELDARHVHPADLRGKHVGGLHRGQLAGEGFLKVAGDGIPNEGHDLLRGGAGDRGRRIQAKSRARRA